MKKSKTNSEKTNRATKGGVSRTHAKTSKTPAANDRQRQYVAGRIAGKSRKRAAEDAGYSARVAEHPGEKLDRQPAVRELFSTLMERAGISDARLAARLAEALDAEETRFWAKDGEVTDQRDVIAHGIRLEAIQLCLQLRGYLIEQHQIDAGPTLAEIVARSYDPTLKNDV